MNSNINEIFPFLGSIFGISCWENAYGWNTCCPWFSERTCSYWEGKGRNSLFLYTSWRLIILSSYNHSSQSYEVLSPLIGFSDLLVLLEFRLLIIICTRHLQGEEGLVHFQWLDRSLNIVEDVSCSRLWLANCLCPMPYLYTLIPPFIYP